MHRVVILAEASEDLEAGRDFYESQDQGLGLYFTDSMLSDIESLALFHGIHPQHFGFYRMLASRFPFGIYYEDATSSTRVLAVLDLRRKPTWIRTEIKKRKD